MPLVGPRGGRCVENAALSDGAPVFFESPAAFRAWLHEHHARATALIVGFHKKATGKPTMTWPESVDEALCYGWIDGIRRSHDATSYTIRFTPRKAKSTWSAINIRRVGELTRLGLMTPAGTAAFARRDPERSEVYSFERRAKAFDADAERTLRRNAKAWAFWHAQRPSYRRTAAHWVMSAKRDATRASRLKTLVACSAKGLWVPPLRAAQPAKSRTAKVPSVGARGSARTRKPPASRVRPPS
ncbi:MAG: YdeI/OmpD-associated family protein [Gemmatimonadetes bacterium]|nr:YdeI/OmpD-associated family protein [Gemmatimonadota bacterium]